MKRKRYTKIHNTLYILITLLVGSLMFPAVSYAAPELNHLFPRTANTFLSWSMTDTQATELAKWDVLVLDMEMQERYPHLLRKIKRLNPDIVLLAYITSQEIVDNASTSYSIMRRRLASGISQQWYLKNAQGKQLVFWPGTSLLNVTNQAAISNGKRWNSYLVDFVIDEIFSTGHWDGVFYDNAWDNITYFAGGHNVDTNNNGQHNSDADQQWQEGMRYIYEETRRRTNNEYIIVGNGTTQYYTNVLNGKLIENFLPHSWEYNMNTYKKNDNTIQKPPVNIINANTANGKISRTDYRHMRFGLGSTLLEDGYYGYDYGDQNHGQTWWYDEYDANLGNPIGDAVSQTGGEIYVPDIWTRPFERGVAVVNSSEFTKTVDLGGEFEAIHGKQDPVANNGAIVSELSLQPFDARILLKTFSSLDDVLFTNGAFARFFRPDGKRVRNGFFVFDEEYKGGDQIAKIDVNNDGKKDLLIESQNKVEVWRHDGSPYFKKYPYTANYKADIRVATGDLNKDGKLEVIVAPAPGSNSPQPIKIYSYSGQTLVDNWYPFGQGYIGGYSVAIANTGNIIIGSGKGRAPEVVLYTSDRVKQSSFFAYETGFRQGVNVATGDVDGDGKDEIITGPGKGGKTWIKVFELTGQLDPKSNFQAYGSFGFPGIDVRAVDVDFDGKDDIVGLSEDVL